MKSIIRLFDRFLRRAQGIFEFWDDPDCMFRARIARAPHTIHLPKGRVPAGAKVLEMHLWNEHVPHIPPGGPSLALAVQGRRMMVSSLRRLASEIQQNPSLADVQAVGAVTVLFTLGDGSGGEKLLTRLGFTTSPYHSPLRWFGEFWENLYTWSLMWAYNAASLRHRRLLSLHRTEVWIERDEFLHRYGGSKIEQEARAASSINL